MTFLTANLVLSMAYFAAMGGVATVTTHFIHRSKRRTLPLGLGLCALVAAFLIADIAASRITATRDYDATLRQTLHAWRIAGFVLVSAFVLGSGLATLLKQRTDGASRVESPRHRLRRATSVLLLAGVLYVATSAPMIRWHVRAGGRFLTVYPYFYPVMKLVEVPTLGAPLRLYFNLWGIRYGNGIYSIRH